MPDPPEVPEPHGGLGGMGVGGGPGHGPGAGAWQPEPTDFQIQNAISTIYAANNEQAAINGALAIFQPSRDPPDAVVNALEHQIAVLRTPPGWTGRLPPPLPWNFDAGRLIEAAYYGHSTAPYLAPAVPAAPGAAAGIAAGRPGNLPPSRTRSARFERRRRPDPPPPQFPDWTPPANSNVGWVNPFALLSQSWMNQQTSFP